MCNLAIEVPSIHSIDNMAGLGSDIQFVNYVLLVKVSYEE